MCGLHGALRVKGELGSEFASEPRAERSPRGERTIETDIRSLVPRGQICERMLRSPERQVRVDECGLAPGKIAALLASDWNEALDLGETAIVELYFSGGDVYDLPRFVCRFRVTPKVSEARRRLVPAAGLEPARLFMVPGF